MNPILNKDSYKLSHPRMYPPGLSGMSAYISARKLGETLTFFGLQQRLCQEKPISMVDIIEAEKFAAAHGEPFDKEIWTKLLTKHNGWAPLKIWAVPEGTNISSGVPLVRIECEDPDFYWMVMDCETWLQRAVWYPTTIASNDLANRRMLKRYLLETSDNMEHLDFMLHDFGARGVSSEESAQIAGAAHLVHFNGSDTISGVLAANRFYDCPMAAFSVPASEHSVQCAWGPMMQDPYLEHVLKVYEGQFGILSIVIDGYDTKREALRLCTTFREQIIKSKMKIVFRPDSGDPKELIPQLLSMQEIAFGSDRNSKGFKKIRHVGLIWGDGIDHESMESILDIVTRNRFAADNIVFGSGGSLLQKVNRDTYGFAMKASAIKVENWHGISKQPVTDSGKNSFKGRMTTLRSKMTGEYMEANLLDGPHAPEWEDVLEPVWDTGVLLRRQTLDDIRKRARS